MRVSRIALGQLMVMKARAGGGIPGNLGRCSCCRPGRSLQALGCPRSCSETHRAVPSLTSVSCPHELLQDP